MSAYGEGTRVHVRVGGIDCKGVVLNKALGNRVTIAWDSGATSTESVERLEALTVIKSIAEFHAVKQIRAHAAEENGVTKRAALAQLDAWLAQQ